MASRTSVTASILLILAPFPRTTHQTGNAPVAEWVERADSVRHVLRGPHSGFASALRAVARDSASFRQLWREAVRGNAGAPAMPQIDFARDMVVFAATGSRNGTGFTISIDSVVVRGPSTEVHVKVGSAGSLCMQGAAMTNPVDVAVVPQRQDIVVFRDRHVVSECKLP